MSTRSEYSVSFTVGILFAVSGVAALMYQVAWQRLLFNVYGLDLQSVTIVVTTFMLGVGVGGLLGGVLSDLYRKYCFTFFVVSEVLIGVFGLCSPWLFSRLETVFDPAAIFINSFVLLLFPTILMGATLPLLSVALIERNMIVADAVGRLYFFNTIGSALGCVLSGFFLFSFFGIKAVVYLCGMLNIFVAFFSMRFVGVKL
ncbi:fused MFS/spermidine synthase [Microbulbifer sp. ANSA002]|uniref:fused MFS/spermidine synthase n=1 Tax=unclassified Microbulbifer TaxID=2619833 RepID=UPI0040426195